MTWKSFLNCRKWATPLLSFPHAKIGIRTLHPDPGHHGSDRERLDSRNQARRYQREGKRVRLFRNGYDWSHRFPLIVEVALRNRRSSFVIDGEAVLLGVDGRSDFNGLHSRQHDEEVQFYAFDMLVSDGEDLRSVPLHLRKNNLARILTRRVDGIFLCDFEQGEIGPDSRAWFRSTVTGPTAAAALRSGLRSRTERITRLIG